MFKGIKQEPMKKNQAYTGTRTKRQRPWGRSPVLVSSVFSGIMATRRATICRPPRLVRQDALHVDSFFYLTHQGGRSHFIPRFPDGRTEVHVSFLCIQRMDSRDGGAWLIPCACHRAWHGSSMCRFWFVDLLINRTRHTSPRANANTAPVG